MFWCLDSNIGDEDIIKMLRSCYSHAFYTELCHNRGEDQAKIMYDRTLQVWVLKFSSLWNLLNDFISF